MGRTNRAADLPEELHAVKRDGKMGKLVVLEGTDGSGKATQCGELCRRLLQEGVPCRQVEFPRYDEPSSALIRMYLGGAFGEHPENVNAYAASVFYAVDRYASYQQDWGSFYESGGLILADRYATSNAVHQGCKLAGAEREKFFDWISDFEYRLLALPAPDLVLYLDVPTSLTEANLHRRASERGKDADLHEKDASYLARCRESAMEAAEHLHWTIIPCTKDNQMRPVSEIHEAVYSAVKEIL